MLSKTKTLTLSILLTAILLYFLLSQIDLALVFQTIIKINPLYLLLGFLCYLSTYTFRTARFYLLLNKSIGFLELFRIVCIHNMFNNLLPARTGELSFIYLLKKFHGKEIGEAAAVLIIARFFDIISITIFFLTSAILLNYFVREVLILFLFVFGLLFAFVILILYSEKIQNILISTKGKPTWLNSIFRILGNVFYSFRILGSPMIIIPALLSSFGVWFFQYLTAFLILKGLSIYLDFIPIVFASTFPIITTLLPIQGFLGFGTTEAGWTLGLTAVGVPLELAVVSGLIWHFIVIIFYLIPGIIVLLQIIRPSS